MAILSALAVDEMFQLLDKRSLGQSLHGAFVLIALVALSLKGTRQAYLHHEQEDLRPLTWVVMKQRQEGDKVVVWQAARFAWFLYSKLAVFNYAEKRMGAYSSILLHNESSKIPIVLDDAKTDDIAAYDNQIDREMGSAK